MAVLFDERATYERGEMNKIAPVFAAVAAATLIPTDAFSFSGASVTRVHNGLVSPSSSSLPLRAVDNIDSDSITTTSSICDIPDAAALSVKSLVGTPEAAAAIRSAVVTNADGDFVRLDDAMGTSSSVVVYLRHMG